MPCKFCELVNRILGIGRPQTRDPGNAGFDERAGTFRIVYQRKELPDPGALNYALETLGLVAFPVSGPSVATRTPIMPLAAPIENRFGVVTSGIPMTAGQIYHQPLFDPDLPGFPIAPTDTTQSQNVASPNNPAVVYDYPQAQPNIVDPSRVGK